MEPAHGRRPSRLALTLWVAPLALAATWVWGEARAAWTYTLFVGLTAVVLAAAASRGRPPWN